jgi:acyl-coenzyme A synthetase/AMP-(fatty) acid ligase
LVEFVDALPKTLTGKIRRVELRERELSRTQSQR